KFNVIPHTTTTLDTSEDYSAVDVTGKITGSLFSLPGGRARVSVGGGFTDEDYTGVTPSLILSSRTLCRRTTYGFREVSTPFVGEASNIPFVHRLEVSVAGRYTNFDDTSSISLGRDFGGGFDPKIGALWEIFPSLALRGTYGTSFRAPNLTELDPAG